MDSAIPNFRDVGGVRGLDGAQVRTGRLLRSAMPARGDVAPEGTGWPPAVVLDLRSAAEHAQEHPLSAPATRLVNLPLMSALREGWHVDAATLAALYGLVLDSAGALLVDLVDEVADADGPALVHCAAGKDRTGISVALVLRLLGVERKDVIADYLLTEQSARAIEARLAAHVHPGAPAVPPHFLAVPRDAIELVLDRWDAHTGGVEGWFAGAGGDPLSLERLRSTMLT